MRNITKNIQFQIDGTPMDFRLTKLDAFSGAELLRMLAGMPTGGGDAGETRGETRGRDFLEKVPPLDPSSKTLKQDTGQGAAKAVCPVFFILPAAAGRREVYWIRPGAWGWGHWTAAAFCGAREKCGGKSGQRPVYHRSPRKNI